MRAGVLCLVLLLSAGVGRAAAENVHFSYLWHLEQPIYWPDQQAAGADRYERAWESIQRTDAGAPHPQNNLREIFSTADRVAAYQHRPKDSIDLIRSRPEAGAQVSFSGGLIENVTSLGLANQLGYGPNWYSFNRTARNWSTVGGKPRMDIVVFPFHHPLLPLVDESAARKEIQLYKQIYDDAWGAAPAISQGLFPPEMAFSPRLIRLLVEEGVSWVVVSSEHLSRACADFPVILGSGGVNCDPPNRADQRNPAQANWLRTSISRGCAPADAFPFSFTPHYARHVDPDTGAAYQIIVVPAAQALSWQDGYSPLGLSEFNTLQSANPANRPQLVLLAHDGDNNWGGGFSYYMEAVPNFVNTASNAGYVATTIQQYLANHPVPAGDIVHVEDGAWVNADGDFGSPRLTNWLWPLVDAGGDVDIPGGWAEDARNWAVITAAQNRVDTAEQIAGTVNLQKILDPDAMSTAAERAWHYFLGGLNSGFMYYGSSLDLEVKPTIACNEAVQHADTVIGAGALDSTPPTIFIPQRHPHNPGSLNFGPQYGYQQAFSNGDFWVWTFVYDVSSVASVTLRYRLDADQALTDANFTYAGGAGVGAWQSLPMTRRIFPAGNFFNDPSINFFEMPAYIADQYHVEVTGLREELVDYYVEAIDGRGAVRRSPIQHVYIGDGAGAGGGGERVVWSPNPAQSGANVLISYDASGGPLAGAGVVKAHIGFNNWQTVVPSDATMTFIAGASRWETTVAVPTTASQVDVAFNNGAGTWDNNAGQDWHVLAVGGQADWVLDGILDGDAQLLSQNAEFRLYAGIKGNVLYVAATDAGEGRDHFIFIADLPGSLVAAPWAKAGQVAGWDAYLADENNNDYESWYDHGLGTPVQAATGANGGVLEGTIDLAAEFGALPNEVWLAFGPYANNDGGALFAAGQVPPGDGNGVLAAAEYVRFAIAEPTFGLGDLNCDGAVDSFDIAAFVLALTDAAAHAAAYPGCDTDLADMNGDGSVDSFDIGLFVDALTG